MAVEESGRGLLYVWSRCYFCVQVYLIYGSYTNDFIDAWVINPVMVECFVVLKGCGRKGRGLL